MKKRVYFYFDETDRKRLEKKIREQGLTGKGRVERFMEHIVRNPILILPDGCVAEIRPMSKNP